MEQLYFVLRNLGPQFPEINRTIIKAKSYSLPSDGIPPNITLT